ncbi:MAG: phenylalanine--tRNA ligase subunit beta, partial [Candidatus Omnitrophica bacterium]|nr:phenylalanine--tRNA ligase subunit beta [Candidatus Omnitrophota bacterium]
MKISINWLKEYVEIPVSVEELVEVLTLSGVEVEKVESLAGDTVLDVEITPNRPDCLHYLGLARETAAMLNTRRSAAEAAGITYPGAGFPVEIENPEDCSRYIGSLIENVSIKSSPAWLTEKFAAVGARTVNNVVDVTNFSLLENGQPLHAFDFDKLIGGKIIVRRAKAGEKIVTIDGAERALDPAILVIADSQRPVAIAGIMGGKATEVTSATKNILLESACFTPVLIRRASRRLSLSTDSSYRFERGVDFTGVARGADRALTLILQAAGGAIIR